MVKTTPLLVPALLVVVAMAAPAAYPVLAVEQSETRPVGKFNAITLAGAMDLVVQPGDTPGFRLLGDKEARASVTSEVKQGRLVILQRDAHQGLFDWSKLFSRHGHKVTCEVTAPAIRAITTSGMCGVDARGLKGDRFEFSAAGAANAAFEGNIKHLELKLNGAGSVDAEQLVAQSAHLDLAGASKVTVNAARSLTINANGASEVTYLGHPELTQELSGSSRVRPKK